MFSQSLKTTFSAIQRYDELTLKERNAFKKAFQITDENQMKKLKIDVETGEKPLEEGGNLLSVIDYVDAYFVKSHAAKESVKQFFNTHGELQSKIVFQTLKSSDRKILGDLYYSKTPFMNEILASRA